MIIGLAGYAGAGKDTVGKILVDYFGFNRVAFADKVRELALRIDPSIYDNEEDMDVPLSYFVERYGWDEAKRDGQVRGLLQRIGAGVRDVVDSDAWVDAAFSDSVLYNTNVVVTDVRYPNELEFIRGMRGAVWWIVRPGVGPVNDHESENSIKQSDADLVVDNSGGIEYTHVVTREALRETLRDTKL